MDVDYDKGLGFERRICRKTYQGPPYLLMGKAW